ncbi:flagellar brake protein [Zhaonella formicivorans]|uniref:flagellar brake protein n=1 Tax=Zhaonella formicivorans TaxID=2528593 RepID=UPI0010E461FB|nr:flagellar brake domain-containing protein [Zhaonella formicivorans]
MQRHQFLVVKRKVELVRENDPVTYKSMIQEVGQDSFAVDVPSYRGQALVLRPGETITVKITGEKEQFLFSTRVLGRKKEPIPLYYLAKPAEVQRIQLREYVRLKTVLEVCYKMLEVEELENLHMLNPSKRAFTVDISGGGVQLALEEELPVNKLLYLKIVLPGYEHQPIYAVGRVKRFLPAGEFQPKHYAGVHFEKIAERDRDVLICYIFEKMRKQRWLER